MKVTLLAGPPAETAKVNNNVVGTVRIMFFGYSLMQNLRVHIDCYKHILFCVGCL